MKPESLKEIIIIFLHPLYGGESSMDPNMAYLQCCAKYIAQITRHVHFLPHSLGNVAQDGDDVQDLIPHGRDLLNTLLCRMVKMVLCSQ